MKKKLKAIFLGIVSAIFMFAWALCFAVGCGAIGFSKYTPWYLAGFIVFLAIDGWVLYSFFIAINRPRNRKEIINACFIQALFGLLRVCIEWNYYQNHLNP